MLSKTLIIIPAHMDSGRFPGKPLGEVLGRPLIHWVYNQAQQVSDTCVCTPDQEIAAYCEDKKIPFVLSPYGIHNGTHRCAESLSAYDRCCDYDVVVNWQCDEPLIEPAWVEQLIAEVRDRWMIGTLVAPLGNNQWQDENIVKVSVSNDHCMWFSRGHLRGAMGHIGVYVYPREALLELGRLKPTELSQAESLEQLAWLENHYPIRAVRVDRLPLTINTPEDLEQLKQIVKDS